MAYLLTWKRKKKQFKVADSLKYKKIDSINLVQPRKPLPWWKPCSKYRLQPAEFISH